jgi:hypothetical protein
MRIFPLLLAVACGGPRTEPANPPTGGDPPAVEAPAAEAGPIGAETITVAELRAHVELLASDDYAGRETLTHGAEMAADYMSKEFERYGLVPLPGRDSFKVPYTLERFGYDETANRLDIAASSGDLKLKIGVDYAPFSFSDSGEIKRAAIVFAGYGINAPKLGWDDYKGLDVKGKIVLVLRHTPNEDRKDDNPLADGPYGQFIAKARTAQERGAAGMLLVTDPRHHGADEDDFKPPSLVRLPRTAEEIARAEKLAEARAKASEAMRRRSTGQRARRPRRAGSKTLLAAHISQTAARALIPDLKEVQEKLDAGAITPREVRVKARAAMAVKASDKPVPVHPDNVVGFLPGSDPELARQWVVIGGHYDHLGSGGGGDDKIFNGADDNASGTAGVLELAQAFATLPTRPARSLVFVGFSGEEKGLLGSFAMLREKQLPEERLVFMLNLDMIGRNPDRPIEIVGDAYSAGIRPILETANQTLGLDIDYAGTKYSGNSDHHPFFTRDIPMMFFFTGTHEDYHQRSDHADKLAYDRMEKIVRLGYHVVAPVAAGTVTPSFVHNLNWLGVTIQVVDGVAVFTGVEAGSRAEKAGIARGDEIVAIAGKPLTEPREVGRRFADLEPGTSSDLELRRAGAARTVAVVRAKRGFLGIFPTRITDEIRQKHGLGDGEGLLVRSVIPKGPADKSGLKQGDILIRVGGVPVDVSSLGRELARIGAGEKTNVVVVRGDKRIDLTMVLGSR